MTSDFLSGFRALDSAALAHEHGVDLDPASLAVADIASLGATLEMATYAQRSKAWSKFAKVHMHRDIAVPLRNAHRSKLKTVVANDVGCLGGYMCLSDVAPERFKPSLLLFDLLARKAMRFRRNVGPSKGLICGAIGEMLDNVFEHSGKPETGIVGFQGTKDYLDVCVSDAGIGVLASLKMNPAYAYLSDAGMALALAVRDGTSRFPTNSGGEGRGHGFSTLFRGLNNLNAEIRLRTDNYALEVGGKGLLNRSPNISEKAHLSGFVVSFRIHL